MCYLVPPEKLISRRDSNYIDSYLRPLAPPVPVPTNARADENSSDLTENQNVHIYHHYGKPNKLRSRQSDYGPLYRDSYGYALSPPTDSHQQDKVVSYLLFSVFLVSID